MKAVILAGGGGTRLWPVSRRRNPKQVEAVIGDRSLLQATYARLRRGFAAKDIFVATAASQSRRIRVQLPSLPFGNLIVEPCRRDTAAAIGYALLRIARREPLETFVIINSDAYVRDVAEYLRVIKAAGRLAAGSPVAAVLIGLKPAYPETGYGYIKTGKLVRRLPAGKGRRSDRVFAVDRFVEKPDLKKARAYLAAGVYLWNPTLVVGRIDRFLKLYGQYLPKQAEIFAAMAKNFGRPGEKAAVARLFARIEPVSIDYGILEKEKDMLVLPADFGWADIGHWRAVQEILSPASGGNVVRCRHVGVDSGCNLIYGRPNRLVATVGVRDMIIVDAGDALLICPRDRAQDVRKLVAAMAKDRQLKKYL